MTQPAALDKFRRALAGAARAIARDPEVEVVFASEVAPASGKTARVVQPGPSLEPRLVAEARGAEIGSEVDLRDVRPEEQRHRPVEDHAEAAVPARHLKQVVGAPEPPGGKAGEPEAQHLGDGLGEDPGQHRAAPLPANTWRPSAASPARGGIRFL